MKLNSITHFTTIENKDELNYYEVMTTKEIPSKQWVNITLTISELKNNPGVLDFKLYVGIDESFNEIILLAERSVKVDNAKCPTTLTNLMDKDIGLCAEVGMWDHTMNHESLFGLFKHGADTYGRVAYN